MSKAEQPTFGSRLREARLRAREPGRGKAPLRQQSLADLIAERLGTVGSPTQQTVGYWEQDRYRPDARDRKLLLAIVGALVAAGGLGGPGAADLLLAAGGYAALTAEEIKRLGFPPGPPPPIDPEALAGALLGRLGPQLRQGGPRCPPWRS